MSVTLPECLSEPMRLHRVADAPLPYEYDLFHRRLARIDLNLHVNTGEWIVLDDIGPEARDIGGMSVWQTIVAVKDTSDIGWTSHELTWHTSGAWFSGFRRFIEMQPDVNWRALQTIPRNWSEESILDRQFKAATGLDRPKVDDDEVAA